MVFSFFKKQSQKMPERPAARPKAPLPPAVPKEAPVAPPVAAPVEAPPAPLTDLEFTTGNLPPPKPVEKPQPVAPASAPARPLAMVEDPDIAIAEFDRDFTDSSVMAIDVAHDLDPLQSDLEQAVVLFANGQDLAARGLLEALIRAYPGSEGRRFWHLLFDLLQIEGDRAAFDKLGVEFAEACETSPPAWRQDEPTEVRNDNGARRFVLQGVLTAEGVAPLLEIELAVVRKQPAVIDCGKLIGCDDETAGHLAELLARARHAGVSLTLEQPEALLRRLDDRLVAGEATHAPSWLLLLELLQRHGTQAAFEERAVDYAVTFELSPPSWDVRPPAAAATARPSTTQRDDAHYLSGDLKTCRFDDLVSVIEQHETPVIDFSGVRRMDFFSAGQLVNRLAPYKSAGREIVIRSPNHLVAELMAVVGLNKQARIIVPKS
ncbi:MAG: STAS domain-containing protein [Bacteroidota bacterium]